MDLDNMVRAIIAQSQRIGAHPSDMLTSISYETGGKFNPGIWGGTNKTMLGLGQFDPENQKKYGITPNDTHEHQVTQLANYLQDRGYKPGMPFLDMYSTINAGRPGRYNASDANNGGAPGTVADKVATQMVQHRARADSMLADYYKRNGMDAPAAPAAAAPVAGAGTVTVRPYQGGGAPAPVADAAAAAPAAQSGGFDAEALTKLLQTIQKEEEIKPQAQTPLSIPHPEQEYMRKAKMAQLALQRQFGEQ